jgi:hypothetical protein
MSNQKSSFNTSKVIVEHVHTRIYVDIIIRSGVSSISTTASGRSSLDDSIIHVMLIPVVNMDGKLIIVNAISPNYSLSISPSLSHISSSRGRGSSRGSPIIVGSRVLLDCRQHAVIDVVNWSRLVLMRIISDNLNSSTSTSTSTSTSSATASNSASGRGAT